MAAHVRSFFSIPSGLLSGLPLPQGGQQSAAQRQLLLDHHRHRVGGILLQHQPGVYPGAGHSRAAHQHPRGEFGAAGRWRAWTLTALGGVGV